MDSNRYQLCYGTRSLEGLRAMKEAMWKIAPTGDYSFSDKLAGQEVLFGAELDTTPLRAALLDRFHGQTVTFGQIDEYVLVETPFGSNHIKRQTLMPMEDNGLITCTSPRRRNRGTYPVGVTVTFPS